MKSFWRRVNFYGPKQPHMRTRCWLWLGGAKRGGYGRLKINGKWVSAHRFAYEIVRGSLGSLKACHHCDVTDCARPSHIFKGTQAENVRDSANKGRHKNPVMFGEANPHAKLTEDRVRALRENPPLRHEKARVAIELGITHRSLNKLLAGERWSGGVP